MNVTITFDAIKRTFRKSAKCKCGKTMRRTKTITQTVNPYNRTAAGVVKTHEQVTADVLNAGRAWEAEAVRCASCEVCS